ncbi:Hsp70 family protein [Glycomyces terrestris]|uniref:Hsp70 family protein n=1 Tax=Glycomyces terrestris TaxID=2493553 RepID=A0A426USZ3_9ACTN|nr:Hsp70 family protein [Glycomyces terrestris]RRR96808.1 Hsp70 family protein [Glycomyces terrestris]
MTDRPTGSASLGVDFGTSHTIAMLAAPGEPARPLLFEGSPLLPSAVFADGGELLVGRFALQQGRRRPAALEPHPKRRIDLDSILLGENEIAVTDAIAAVLTRVRTEAVRVAGSLAAVTVTVPATWGPTRRQTISEAAERAGLGAVRLVPEPVAAAAYFLRRLGHRIDHGQAVVVYDLGAGTFDATVVARRGGGFEVLSQDGRADLGGLDIDARIAEHLRLQHPGIGEGGEGRHYRALLDELRLAKESLSTYSRAEFTVPPGDVETHLTRGELDDLARPLLAQTVKVTKAVIAAAGLAPAQTAGVFLVGGASRMPLVATVLHQQLGLAPTVIEQPELVVAEGGLIAGTAAAADETVDLAGATPGRTPASPVTPAPTPPPEAIESPAPALTPAAGTPPAPAFTPAATASPAPAPTPPSDRPADPVLPPAPEAPRPPVQILASALLLAFLAVPLIPLWGGAIERGIAQGALHPLDPQLLYGAFNAVLGSAMVACPVAAVLVLRRVRWSPLVAIAAAAAVPFAVLPVMPNETIAERESVLGLVMVVAAFAVIAGLFLGRAREWLAGEPAAKGRRLRRALGIAAQALAAVAAVFALLFVLHEFWPTVFW